MVDVPRALEPSDAERLAALRQAMTPGGVDGQSRAVGPIWQRDRAQAQVVGAGESDAVDARESKVDTWTVTGTGTATFTTTFSPIEDSWNLELNGVRVHKAEFAVSGQTVTILDPTTLFAGASGGDPWDLEMQYDYFAGVPTSPVIAVEGIVATLDIETITDAMVVNLTGLGLVDGDFIILGAVHGQTPSSFTAGWTQRANPQVTKTLTVLTRTALASDTSVTINYPTIQWCNVCLVVLRGASYSAVASGTGAASTTFTTPSVAVPGGGMAVYLTAHENHNVFAYDSLTMDEQRNGVQDFLGIAHDLTGAAQGCTAGGSNAWESVVVAVGGV